MFTRYTINSESFKLNSVCAGANQLRISTVGLRKSRVCFSCVFFTYANALPNRKALHAQLHCANPNETMGCEPIIAEYHQTRSALVETSSPGESLNQA